MRANTQARASESVYAAGEFQDSRPAVYAAAGLSLATSLAHLWVMPGHFLEWWGYGLFFLTVSLAQGIAAVCLLRSPTQLSLLLAAVAGNMSIVLLYVMTRTTGIPVGPHAGEPENAGMLDLTTTAAEVGLIVILTSLLDGVARRRTINALLAIGGTLWVLRLADLL